MSAWIVIAGCAALAAAAAFFLARALSKAKQAAVVEDARQRMDAVSDDRPPHYTAERLRNSRW